MAVLTSAETEMGLLAILKMMFSGTESSVGAEGSEPEGSGSSSHRDEDDIPHCHRCQSRVEDGEIIDGPTMLTSTGGRANPGCWEECSACSRGNRTECTHCEGVGVVRACRFDGLLEYVGERMRRVLLSTPKPNLRRSFTPEEAVMVCAAIEPAILMMTFGVPPNNAGRRTARAVCAVVVKTTQDVLIARLASRVVGTQVKEAALLLDLADVSLRTPDEEAKWESSFVRAVIIGTRAVLYGVFSPAGQRIPGVPDVIDGAFASLYGRQLADERRALARELIKQYDSPHR